MPPTELIMSTTTPELRPGIRHLQIFCIMWCSGSDGTTLKRITCTPRWRIDTRSQAGPVGPLLPPPPLSRAVSLTLLDLFRRASVGRIHLFSFVILSRHHHHHHRLDSASTLRHLKGSELYYTLRLARLQFPSRSLEEAIESSKLHNS